MMGCGGGRGAATNGRGAWEGGSAFNQNDCFETQVSGRPCIIHFRTQKGKFKNVEIFYVLSQTGARESVDANGGHLRTLSEKEQINIT